MILIFIFFSVSVSYHAVISFYLLMYKLVQSLTQIINNKLLNIYNQILKLLSNINIKIEQIIIQILSYIIKNLQNFIIHNFFSDMHDFI